MDLTPHVDSKTIQLLKKTLIPQPEEKSQGHGQNLVEEDGNEEHLEFGESAPSKAIQIDGVVEADLEAKPEGKFRKNEETKRFKFRKQDHQEDKKKEKKPKEEDNQLGLSLTDSDQEEDPDILPPSP